MSMMKVFLTGATGFLGGELAVALSKSCCVDKLVCLVRAKNNDEADARLRSVFGVHQDPYDPKKVVALAGDLLNEDLPVFLDRHRSLSDTNIVIHAAANTS